MSATETDASRVTATPDAKTKVLYVNKKKKEKASWQESNPSYVSKYRPNECHVSTSSATEQQSGKWVAKNRSVRKVKWSLLPPLIRTSVVNVECVGVDLRVHDRLHLAVLLFEPRARFTSSSISAQIGSWLHCF